MPRIVSRTDALTKLLGSSSRPIYAVDASRRIVYCNAALAAWLDLEPQRIVGRLVEYHSEQPVASTRSDDGDAALTDLCPPPRALAGEACGGTISCVDRSGRLVHRRAEFVPLDADDSGNGVLVLLAQWDLTPQEVAAQISPSDSADELHRAIRRFRRAEVARYSAQTLLGDSPAMRKLRAQVAAAAESGANALICGPRGSGRGHVARAIHYRAAGEAEVRLVPLDCELANEHLLGKAFEAAGTPSGDPRRPTTLLLENLNRLPEPYQAHLLMAMHRPGWSARVIATCERPRPLDAQDDAREEEAPAHGDSMCERDQPAQLTFIAGIKPELFNAISTITISLPPLAERIEDLPVLAQFFLEACNRGSNKQVGSLRPEALDALALHNWPGELDELRAVITAAHRACRSHEIAVGDLPPVVQHAMSAAAHARRQPERIVLDQLLSEIEREAIVRALAQAGGNKTVAAGLLGMTRPRLYRRLVQLGLAGPEFVEFGSAEEGT